MAVTDEELVSRAREGSLDAFDELVARHQDRVHYLAYRMLGSSEDAADAQQETFVKAWTSLKRFRGDASFHTWLHRITFNLCLSRKRRKDWSAETVSYDDSLAYSEPGGTLCAERIETAIVVRSVLAAIPAHHRALIVLRDMEGRPFEEIAEIVGGSVESVRTRLSRARKVLRDKMRPYLEEEEI